jgi:predicted ATPase/class 3 adenylate cyclase
MKDETVETAPIMGGRPSGTVTFLFTDVEGSTRLWAADAAAMSSSLLVHDSILRDAIEAEGGYVFTTAGDSFAAAFSKASDAVNAAERIQTGLADAAWPGPVLRVRIGVHLGEAEERGGDYFGPVVNTTARVEAAGHGGQTLITDTVRVAARVDATDLGVHRLRDVDEPMHLFQIGDGVFPPLRALANAPETNLPARPNRLIGRAAATAEVRQLLTAHRLVTLSAVGGSGKTRLAIAVGEEELHHRSGGVWFVDLTPVMNPSEIAAAVAGATGLRLTSGDATAQVVAFFADKAALVILDNCEHVIDGCAEFVEAMLAAPGATVMLATSREALDVDGERVMHVGSLATLDGDHTGRAISPAVELFAERAIAIDPGFAMSDDDAPIVAELCARLDGMPLAIELAAARVTVMSPAELLSGLDDRFNLLSGGRRRQRQRTLEATLDWSYDLLDEEQQRVFRSLGVFVGGFDVDAVAAVAELPRPQALDAIEDLVAKSLVVRVRGADTSRFTLLETLKAYAEDRLVQRHEASTARDAHAGHFHRLAAHAGRIMVPDVRVGERLRFDRSNITAAFDWSASNRQWSRAGELLLGGLGAYENYGHGIEALSLFDRCETMLDEVDVELADCLRTAVTNTLIVVAEFTRLIQTARRLQTSAFPAYRVVGSTCLAFISALRSPDRVAAYLERARHDLVLAQTEQPGLNSDLAQSQIASMEALVLVYAADYHGAIAKADQIRDDSDRLGYSTVDDGIRLYITAGAHLLVGDPATTLELLEVLSDRPFPYEVGGFRALAHLALGHLEIAREEIRLHAADAIVGRLSMQANDTVLLFAALADAEGDQEKAAELMLQMGTGRSPITIKYGEELAKRLGVDELYTSQFVTERTGDYLGADRAMAAVRREAARRGWIDA